MLKSESVTIYHELEKTKHVEILVVLHSIENPCKKFRNLIFFDKSAHINCKCRP